MKWIIVENFKDKKLYNLTPKIISKWSLDIFSVKSVKTCLLFATSYSVDVGYRALITLELPIP